MCLPAFSQWNYSLGMDKDNCDKKDMDITSACLPSASGITYLAWTEKFVTKRTQDYDKSLPAFSQLNYLLGMDRDICDKKDTEI